MYVARGFRTAGFPLATSVGRATRHEGSPVEGVLREPSSPALFEQGEARRTRALRCAEVALQPCPIQCFHPPPCCLVVDRPQAHDQGLRPGDLERTLQPQHSFAIGHISGCHLNPAVSIGLWSGGRFPASELGPYIGAQLAGGVLGAAVLYFIASGAAGFDLAGGFASNGYGEHSPGGYSLAAGFTAEFVLTFMFLIIILGATDERAPAGLAPIAIGLGLTLIHLVGIPITNTSVNPARSTGPALFVQGWALGQLWLFWVAPIAGAAVAGIVYRKVGGSPESPASS